MHDRAPEAAGIQYIGLIHAAELLIALLGRLKADAADPLDLMLGVGHRIDGLLLAICQRLGLVLAEVHAADQLPDNEEVDALCHDLRLEGAGGSQLGPDLGGAEVGVKAHAGTEAEQAFLGALIAGHPLPLGAAHRTQQDAVGGQALVQLVLRQRVAVLVNGLAAHGSVGIVERMAILFGHLIENTEGLLHDFRAGAIAPDDGNILLHSSVTSFIGSTSCNLSVSHSLDSSPSRGALGKEVSFSMKLIYVYWKTLRNAKASPTRGGGIERQRR